MSSTKTGRPKVINPKDIDVKVRIDQVTHQKLLNYCETNKMTKASAIRKGINLLLDTQSTQKQKKD